MRRRVSIGVILFVVSILLLSNIFNFNASEARSSTDTGYDPFYLIGDNETLIAHHHIQGDAELIQFVDDYGTGGSGTSVDPYNVSGLYVPVDTGEKCGLLIENTTLHISFDDLEINEGSYYSMVISNGSNISLISSTIHSLLIQKSSNMTFIDMTLISAGSVVDSSGIILQENRGYLHFSFINSEDIRIRWNNCSVSTTGFYFNNCIDVNIENNTFKSTRYNLITTSNYNSILVRNNTFLGDYYGLFLSGDSSSVFRISGNIFSSFDQAGIIINDVNCWIYDNLFEENGKGLHIRVDSNTTVTGNIFLKNYYSSLDFYGDWDPYSDHIVNGNTFYRNSGSSSYYDPSDRQIPDMIEQPGYDQYNFDGNWWYDWKIYDDENEDGIVDSPYVLGPNESYEMDRYPLVKSPHLPTSPKIETIERKGDYVMINWSPVVDRFLPILDYSISMNGPGVHVFKSYDADVYGSSKTLLIQGYEGLFTFELKSYNLLGQSALCDVSEIFITGDMPVLYIVSPKNGSYLNDLGCYLTFQVHDNESSSLLQIYVKLDESPWEEFEYYYWSISYLFTIFSIEPQDGEHTISVRVRDPGGNVVERSITFILDRSRPIINFISPESEEYSTEKEVEVAWEIISESIRSISFRLGDEYNGLTDWIELTNLDQRGMKLHINRSTTFYLMVEDLAGNVRDAYIHLRYDGTPPYLSTMPVHYSTTSLYYINYDNYDEESGIENNYLSFDGSLWTEIGHDRTSYELINVTEGRYEIFIRSVNYAGLSVTVSFELIVDLTPPVITSVTPISGGYYNRELTRITWDADDNISDIGKTYIEFNGEMMIEIDPGVEFYDIPFLLKGENRFNITAFNGVGLGSKEEVTFYIDNIKPTIDWRYPFGEIEEWNGTIHVVFSKKILRTTISIYIDDLDNTIFGEQFWLSDTELVFVPTFLPMDNIEHSIKVTGKDKSGNEINDYKWFFINVSSTGAVTGRIVDEDGKPIKGVAIYIDDLVYFLDDNASFLIPLCDGQHWIEVRKEGFSTLRMDFNISNGGDKNLGDLELRYEEVGSPLNPINIIIATVLLFVLITALTFFIYRRRRYFNEFNIPLTTNPKVREVRKSIREIDPDREGNFYDFLSIDQGANVKEIRLAYRKKAVLYHPDGLSRLSTQKREQAQEKMKRLNMIRDILTEPMTRAIYDREIKDHRRINQ